MSEYKALIPALTSNNDQGFVITASSQLTGVMWHAGFLMFDHKNVNGSNNGWHTDNMPQQYLKISFPNIKSASKLTLMSFPSSIISSVYPNAWRIAYSLDDITYTDICTINTEQVLPSKEYSVIFNTITFKYIKIYKTTGGYGTLGGISNI